MTYRQSIFALFLISSCWFNTAIAQEFTATVSSTSIGINESILLNIRLEDNKRISTPDFNTLNLQFDILSNSRETQRSIINGKQTWVGEWQLLLSPKEAGDLVIPSFSYQQLFTEAITIHVSDKKTEHKAPKDNIFLQVNLDKSTLYVQEQLLVSVKLHTRVPLNDYTVEEPKLPNAAIEQVAEKKYRSNINNKAYTTLEIIYAIYPQQSGQYTLPALNWQVQQASGRRGLLNHNIGRLNQREYTITSEEHTIEVLPVPATFAATHWLPATTVTLSEKWSQSLLQAKVGEPLQREIIIHGQYLSSAQLPTIILEKQPGFKFYQDQPTLNEDKTEQGINATRSEHYAIVPTAAGTYTLPAVSVQWWDIHTQQIQTATLPEQTVIVGSSPLTANPNTTTAIDTTDAITPAPPLAMAPTVSNNPFWQWLSIVFAVLALTFLYLWQRAKRTLPAPTPVHNPVSQSINEATAFSHLSAAAAQENFTELRRTTIIWAQVFLNNKRIASLADITRQLPQLHSILMGLDNQLYGGAQQSSNWHAKDLVTAIEHARAQAKNHPKTPREHLAPLYPS